MRIARAEEQGIRLALRLARDGGQVTLAELAQRESLPEPTVAKILSRLREAGVVSAVRGRKGGYELAGPAEAMSVATIVQAMGLPRFAGRFCTAATTQADCPHGSSCSLRPVWNFLEERMFRVLEQTSLADLLHTQREVHAHVADVWRQDVDADGPGDPDQQEAR